MKIIRNIFLGGWSLFCFIGIVGAIPNYDLADWAVIIPFIMTPYIIVYFISKKVKKNVSSMAISKTEESNSTTQCVSHETRKIENTDPSNLDVSVQKPESLEKIDATSELIKTASENTPVFNQEAYVETEKTFYRVDGNSISDNEIPYLMQIGYEKALEKSGLYKGQVLDLSSMQARDKNKKEYTRIPSYEELSIIEPADSQINSIDIAFLKYIDGLTLEKPFIAQYWFYEYNLNYSEEIKKLIAAELLVIQKFNIEKLKMSELKDILKKFNLSLTGKKKDLQERIRSNITDYELLSFFGNESHYFCSTPKGKVLINNTCDSATKNIDLENECLKLILNHDFEGAYILISSFKSTIPSGMDFSFSYNANMDKLYKNIMDSTTFFYTLSINREIESRIRASIVFCRMYGCGQNSILKIIKRIYHDEGKIFDEDSKNILRGRLL